ncbi:MAG TPA: 3-deoxy-D-manno-octulosonic acid transferase [Thermodesulfovibrionia bacterium]|nr:3-deoxy-D-manno-octulosonic acid transferase [Thermodesulfovibrionia bacterium]
MMYFLYDILSFLALFGYIPILLTKKGPVSRKVFLLERLGLSDYDRADIWVHAVSVGEVIAVLPLLKAIKKEWPEKRVLLSTITYTGQRVANEKFPEADRIMYLPWDSSLIIKRVAKKVKPALFFTVETELWPNLFRILKQQGAAVLVMNGRLSESSYKGYKRVKFFIKDLLCRIDGMYMQDQTSADRALALGAPADRVQVIGNLKFDMKPVQKQLLWAEKLHGQILTAGSTHRGEDEIVLAAFKQIQRQIQHAKLILAPRHPERFDEVEGLLKKEQFSYVMRSKIDQNEEKMHKASVILLDTIGELSGVYAISHVAFVGGSLVPVGGHNILEPAYWSVPVVFGPHMNNFPIAESFLAEQAALEVRSEDQFAQAVIKLMKSEQEAKELGARGRALVDKNLGAVDRAIEVLRKIMEKS